MDCLLNDGNESINESFTKTMATKTKVNEFFAEMIEMNT